MRIISLIAISLVAAISMMLPHAAMAAGQNGVEESGELVFFYNSGFNGSFTDFAHKKNDLACCTFITSGNGHGQTVKNNAALVRSWNTDTARVYYNSDYMGIYDTIAPLTGAALVNTYNENASFKWIS